MKCLYVFNALNFIFASNKLRGYACSILACLFGGCRESQISRLLGCRKLGALLLAVGVMILCVSLVSGNVQTRNLPQRAVASQLLDGRYQEYYKSCTDLYVYLEQTKEADVVIISMPDNIDCFNNLYISRDKDHYANRAMAQFYGKESIVIQ